MLHTYSRLVLLLAFMSTPTVGAYGLDSPTHAVTRGQSAHSASPDVTKQTFGLDALLAVVQALGGRKPDTSNKETTLRLYEELLTLQQDSGFYFLEALKAYQRSVEGHAPLLERDFRYAQVGEKAAAVVQGIENVRSALRSLQPPLDLTDSELVRHIDGYMGRRGSLTGDEILRDHRLRGLTPSDLRAVVKRAEDNAALLDKTVAEMGAVVCRKYPDQCSDPGK